jgi:hypothetical protein
MVCILGGTKELWELTRIRFENFISSYRWLAFFIHRRKNIVQKYMEMVSNSIFRDSEEMSDMIKVSPY